MDEKISKLFLPLLDKLYNTEPAGEPFRRPVDVVKYGCYDYYLYVKHPIDLSTIREKLLTNQYKGDAWRFISDIQLMFSNAYLFNKKGTPVYEFTNKLNKIWNQELTPIMQRLNYCCGTLHKFGPQLLFCHGTTQDRYCQIPIGAKYKCYQDQYSFCVPCFNKINSEFVNIQNLSCETTRMKLPTQPVKKSDFKDCANDLWQYEQFIKCTKCTRRVHQICDLYPAKEEEIDDCTQHEQIEDEQKMLCQVPPEYRTNDDEQEINTTINNSSKASAETSTTTTIDSDQDYCLRRKAQQTFNDDKKEEKTASVELITIDEEDEERTNQGEQKNRIIQETITQTNSEQLQVQQQQQHSLPSSTSLDDELLQFAKDVDDSTNSAPVSPNPQQSESTKETLGCQKKTTTSNAKNSVDKIAARLSIHKMSGDTLNLDERLEFEGKEGGNTKQYRDKYVCNHCYRKEKIGLNLRHRKYSARRLPHTRMSRYIETKVNDHIREHSLTAGEVTIRVLTAYEDILLVKPEMSEYVRKCRESDSIFEHPNAKNYPNEFKYMNRALFAWQEIDGVDVCVFGMHVQEYGEDCPEPNRRVIYLSYLDSVHFFRPKQVRTAVYHEILLSYFKYVKKLGFRRVFIWVCPSRKGDDYIFYRHPTEQKMPTLKRLSDWYVNLLDKGIMEGIVEKHHNILQYVTSQNLKSILSMPYLSGDYWPGEFERLLNIMIESQKVYEKRRQEDTKDNIVNENITKIQDISDLDGCTSNSINSINNISNHFNPIIDRHLEQNNILSLTSIYQKAPPNSSNGKIFNMKNSLMNSYPQLKPSKGPASMCYIPEAGNFGNISMNDVDLKNFNDNLFTPNSPKIDSDQPLDLSKSSANTSPESYCSDGSTPFNNICNPSLGGRKRRRKSYSLGYPKKKNRVSTNTSASSQIVTSTNPKGFRPSNQNSFTSCESYAFSSQPIKSITTRQKSNTQSKESFQSDQILSPEEELARNLERSLRRQREGFIVARLSECDCSPHFESQRRKEEATFTCELMKGREPFLQLARTKNYEFSSLRRAKFSSLAMIKHLGLTFKMEPICNECFSFDSSKRHYGCTLCEDFYLCTSCHEMTLHEHNMSLVPPSTLPDIDEFLQQCSSSSTTNSVSSASSTISNKSFNESNLNIATEPATPTTKRDIIETSTPLNRHLSNSLSSSIMPLGCKLQKNHSLDVDKPLTRAEDEENAEVCPFDNGTTKLILPNQPVPPPSHSPNSNRGINNLNLELDQVIVENFIRHAEVSYDVDFDQMRGESEKLLTHYWTCPIKETCHKCKFVVLSCSFMSVLMKRTRMQMMINFNPSEILPISSNNNNNSTSNNNNNSNTNNNNNNNNNNTSYHSNGINLTTANRYKYQSKDRK